MVKIVKSKSNNKKKGQRKIQKQKENPSFNLSLQFSLLQINCIFLDLSFLPLVLGILASILVFPPKPSPLKSAIL